MKYLFSLFLLASPAYAQASDGYKFLGDPPALRHEFTTEVVEYNSRRELEEASIKFGLGHLEVHAFSTFNKNTNVCTIHIIKPSFRYLPEHIGHELIHCVYGKWHS